MSFGKEMCGKMSHEQELCTLLQQISLNLAPTCPNRCHTVKCAGLSDSTCTDLSSYS